MRINKLRGIIVAGLLAVSNLLSFPTQAKTFTSAEFLTWKQDSQDFFIEASVGMAASISSQITGKKQQASCIDKWYYPEQEKKNYFIRDIMRENSEYHPRAIIIGVLEKQCGEF